MICHICKETLFRANYTEFSESNHYISCPQNHLCIYYDADEEIVSYEILLSKDNMEYIIVADHNEKIHGETVIYENYYNGSSQVTKIISKINMFYPPPIENGMIQADRLFNEIKLLNIFS